MSSSQQPLYILPKHFLLFLISKRGLSTNFHIKNVIPVFETIKQSAVTSIILRALFAAHFFLPVPVKWNCWSRNHITLTPSILPTALDQHCFSHNSHFLERSAVVFFYRWNLVCFSAKPELSMISYTFLRFNISSLRSNPQLFFCD
jgi:hypothetical protein